MTTPANDRLADKRVRAAKACQRCNQRRVRCDASEAGLPCTRCKTAGQTECRLIDTRRGRYSRDQIKARAAAARAENAQRNEGLISPSSTTSSTKDDATAAEEGGKDVRPISLQYCRGAEYAPSSEGPEHGASPNDATASNEFAYRDVSWSAMFNHFLDGRHNNRQDMIDKCSITYLGESFPLALVLEDLQDGGRTKLHHAGPPLGQAQTPSDKQHDNSHPAHLLPEDMNCLRNKQALEYPDKMLFESLMSTFVDVVFPMYPIVSRDEFIEQYKNRQVPWILLQSACFAAATHCPITVLNRAGFSGRRQARFFFYRKAKALFDTGYESNKIVILQSIMLLSMWGGSPNNYWNFYSWINTGITLAETMGLHRSIAGMNMEPKDTSLLRRIWWVLVIRDAFCATLVGRPLRVNMDQGDAEMLTLEDFEQDIRSLEAAQHHLAYTFGHYQIQAAKLSLILHQVVMTRFIPGPKKYTTAFLQDSLENWRKEVPPEIDWSHDPLGNNLLASCLSILFDHHLILANLGCSLSQASTGFASGGFDQHSDLAAQRISTLSSSIVVRSQALQIPHETFQGVFLAGVVSYTQMRCPNATVAQLGYSNLNNSKMVLHNVLEAWDPVPWITTLFDSLTANLQKKQTSSGDPAIGQANGLLPNEPGDVSDLFGSQDVDYGICTPWQSNPMLNALFDFSEDFGGIDFQGDSIHAGNFGA